MPNNLKRAIETDLGCLRTTGRERARILRNALEGKKVKKKLSVGFVLMIILILAVVTALAVTLSGYFAGFARMENTYGDDLAKWPVAAKVELVQLMADNDLLINKEMTAHLQSSDLSQEQQETLVDEILQTYFTDTEHLSTFNVMQHELGAFDLWHYEEKALYTSLLIQYGQQKDDWPRYLLPEPGDEPESRAIMTAKQAITLTYVIEEETLNTYTLVTSFMQISEFGDEPVWLVSFHRPDAFGMYYEVVMNRNGGIRTIEAPGQNPITLGESSAVQALSTCILPADATPAVLHEYDVKPEYAMMNARSFLTEVVDLSAEAAERYDVRGAFIYSEQFNNGQEPVWMMTVSLDGTPVYKVLAAYNGQHIDGAPVGKEFTYVQRSGRVLGGDPSLLINDQGEYFYQWTLEEKAAFSMRWVPLVHDFAEQNPYFTGECNNIWAWTRRVYGLPGTDDITQDHALRIALEQVRKMGASQEEMELLANQLVFFDISNPDQPLWLIVLIRTLPAGLSDQEATQLQERLKDEPRQYFITINARSGDVADAYGSGDANAITTFLATPYQANGTQNEGKAAMELPALGEAGSVYGVVNTKTGERAGNVIPATVSSYDATREQALASARAALAEHAGLTLQAVEEYTSNASFFYNIWYSLGEAPVWLVHFSLEEMPMYKVLLNHAAKYIDWAYADEDFQTLSYRDEVTRADPFYSPTNILENDQNVFITRWSHEERAAFSEKWIPIAEAYQESHPYFTGSESDIWRYTRRVFGIPTDQEISQEEAFAVAKNALKAYGETDQTFAERNEYDEVFYFFDATKPDQPQWRLAICFDSRNGQYRMGDRRCYFVKINARTGDIMDVRASIYSDWLYTFISEP